MTIALLRIEQGTKRVYLTGGLAAVGLRMSVTTVNPYTRKNLAEYRTETLEEVKAKITKLRSAQQEWKLDIDRRLEALAAAKKRMESNLQALSSLMSQEMGKPVAQSEAEVKKCIWTMDYIIENSRTFLAPEQVKTEAKKSYVRFDPLGIVLSYALELPRLASNSSSRTRNRVRQRRAAKTRLHSIWH